MIPYEKFRSIIREVKYDMYMCDIRFDNIIDFYVFSKETIKKNPAVYGLCTFEENRFKIGVHPYLLEIEDMHGLYSTLAHELLHTGEGYMAEHGEVWQRNAKKLEKAYPGKYTIKEFIDIKELGLEGRHQRYELTCSACGGKYYYTTKSHMVKNYESTDCPECGKWNTLSLKIRPRKELLSLDKIDYSAKEYHFE